MDLAGLEVWGKFTPRGGISIDPLTTTTADLEPVARLASRTTPLPTRSFSPEKIDNQANSYSMKIKEQTRKQLQIAQSTALRL